MWKITYNGHLYMISVYLYDVNLYFLSKQVVYIRNFPFYFWSEKRKGGMLFEQLFFVQLIGLLKI